MAGCEESQGQKLLLRSDDGWCFLSFREVFGLHWAGFLFLSFSHFPSIEPLRTRPGRKRQKQEGLTTDWRPLFREDSVVFAILQSYALFCYILDACICRWER
jgi:hypothetical protein